MLSKINIFKRIRLNNFVGGLIFGAIFSLIVNIVTVQLQEKLTKQKYLEALELEIQNHITEAHHEFSGAEHVLQVAPTEEGISATWRSGRYETIIWDSTNSLIYTYDMNPGYRTNLVNYYNWVVRTTNRHLDRTEESITRNFYVWSDCYNLQTPKECEKLKNSYNTLVGSANESRKRNANITKDHAAELLKVFHPIEDRKNNWFLNIFLGD